MHGIDGGPLDKRSEASGLPYLQSLETKYWVGAFVNFPGASHTSLLPTLFPARRLDRSRAKQDKILSLGPMQQASSDFAPASTRFAYDVQVNESLVHCSAL
jgi:hypothetical protein